MTLDARRNPSDRRVAPVRRGKDTDRSSSRRSDVSRSSGVVTASKPKENINPPDLNQPPTKASVSGLVSKRSHTLKITQKIGDDRNNITTTP